MSFAEELDRFLPLDIPNRETCVEKGARHLELISQVNRQFNLTRIVDPREAVIKHTVDSLLPWKLFVSSGARRVVDAGSGPGFPGIPLAIALPEIRFILLESTGKKARFIASAIEELNLQNVEVYAERAEDWFKQNRAPLFTARAIAPLQRAVILFSPALRAGTRALLYKGPEVDAEIEAAAAPPGCRLRVVDRYELPEALGSRTIVEMLSSPGPGGGKSRR